ncbi:MAG: hypothetical protein H0X35_10585 [Pseudonocardiales bacterium]|nr:hypothetical protein [Pseudonocardiales bacterium]
MTGNSPQPGKAPPRLSHDELVAAQQETLAMPRRRYGLAARPLFVLMDIVYGRRRTLSKFKVLEIVARVPYQAWEQVAYIAVTHVHHRAGLTGRIHERVREARAQQDNEQWHLLALEDLIRQSDFRESSLMYFWLPQALAFGYYQLAWLLLVIHPKWSYQLNADFEDHAEHEYMLFVDEHPEWESESLAADFEEEHGRFASVADLFRQIGHDERVHKQESVSRIREARFR